MKKGIFALLLVSLILTADAATSQVVTIGPRFSWTFGPSSTYSYGFEISAFPEKAFKLGGVPVYGYTLDLTRISSRDETLIHIGAESFVVSHDAQIASGIDVGPTLFVQKDKLVHFGASAIIWTGVLIYPFFEIAVPLDSEPRYFLGGYLKVPVIFPEIGSVG